MACIFTVGLLSRRFIRGYLSSAMLASFCCGRLGNVTIGLAKGTSSMLGLTLGRSPWFTRQVPGPPPPQLIQCRGLKERHKKIIKMAKGYRARTNCYRIAIGRVEKALQYQYRDRKVQKRDWRKLWIHRITAAVKQYRLTYSRFIPGLRAANINLNRKILADLAVTEPYSFKSVVDTVKSTPQIAWDKTHLSVHR